ncbi:MAG: NADH-quinone oxidoreductase subunit D, partial [Candidatus Omnitrophica bacterium]|nr:NADH-quinone oxidoreductase subunit D [Candidatus Omnitrophota bacterium]
TYNYIRIGGVAHDIPAGFVEKTREFIKYFRPVIDEYNRLLSENPIFVKRTANVGVLSAAAAKSYGVTGPTLRGSGIKRDLRKDMPYSVYSKFDFDVIVGDGAKGSVGDCWDRYMVRILEMNECLKIIEQALDALPEGDVLTKVPRILNVPPGEAYVRTETPRGELGFYIISDGSSKPFRMKIRTPSFCNLSVLPELCRGVLVADVVAILGSIDIVLGEVDR